MNVNVAYKDNGQALEKEVVVIPASVQHTEKVVEKKNLRVAAYCRVSTDHEDQLQSYETQIKFYTQKINETPNWKLVKIYADEGLSATSTKKRVEFNQMIEDCQKGKIDMIITKSTSRFARNTLDTIHYVRMLKDLGVTIIFEKEGINTSEIQSELILQLYAMFAQAESESISNNEKDGRRKGYKIGKVPMMYGNLLGYRKGPDGEPEIVPEEASIVIYIFTKFIEGMSIGGIKAELEAKGIKTVRGNTSWSHSVIQSILKNEKYKGDVLMQKSFIADLFSKKTVKNTGALPQYLIKNHHIPIIEPEVFDRVQYEFARRNTHKTMKGKGDVIRSKYSSKYALTDILVCGECGANYKRVTWTSRGNKRIVWRCTSRTEHGTKLCKHSPTIPEEELQKAITNALNIMLATKTTIKEILKGSMIAILGASKSEKKIGELTNEIAMLNNQIFDVIQNEVSKRADADEIEQKCKEIYDKIAAYKEELKTLNLKKQSSETGANKLREICEALDDMEMQFEEYDDSIVRRLISRIRVMDRNTIIITFCGSVDVEQKL